jgi:hypothetical protein
MAIQTCIKEGPRLYEVQIYVYFIFSNNILVQKIHIYCIFPPLLKWHYIPKIKDLSNQYYCLHIYLASLHVRQSTSVDSDLIVIHQTRTHKVYVIFMVTYDRLWVSPGLPVSSTNKTDCHDITEIYLKMALNTINQTKPSSCVQT